jgi:hypothetical protein
MEAKGFKTSVSKNGKYVRIDVYKPVTSELEKTFFHDCVKIMKRHNIINVLVNVSGVPNIAGELNDYTLAYRETKRVDYPSNGKIAVLVDPSDSSHDFIEIVFNNAGYNCTFFDEEGDAIKWLEE